MRIRVAFGVLIGVLALFPLAGSASACATASLTLSSSAGPGDTVWFSISGIEPGATYSLSLDGREVASGTNNTSYNGVSGTFTMPDFGARPLTVTGFAHTFHAADSDTQDPASSMAYEPPGPPPPPVGASAPKGSAEPTQQASVRKHHRPPLPIAIAKHEAKKQRHDSPSTGTAVGAAPADAVGSEPGPSNPNSGSGEAKTSDEASSSAPHRVLDALGSTTKVGPAGVPTIGLLAIALIFIVGTGLAALVIYISQTGPDPQAATKAPAPLGHDPVEVELQEMIGEEMARQLLSDLDLAEPPVSSS
jgi:hypothetical protein